MTPSQIIQALRDMDLSYYRIAKDTRFNKETVRNWHLEKSKPYGRNLEDLERYAKDKGVL